MKIVKGNLFDFVPTSDAILVPTNLSIRRDGKAVMGAGVARHVRDRWPGIDEIYGHYLETMDWEAPHPVMIGLVNRDGKLFLPQAIQRPQDQGYCQVWAFPTKKSWQNPADLALIHFMGLHMGEAATGYQLRQITLPKLGCGMGGLNWDLQVLPTLSSIFDDRFIAVVE